LKTLLPRTYLNVTV